MKKGKCIIFSAPSGAGKTTIVQHLLREMEELSFSVSATTRKPRVYEKHGEDYYFLSVDEFKNHIENNDFLEWEEVYKDCYYGTLKSEVSRIWETGKHVIFDVDVVGGKNLKENLGDTALGIFVQPPSVNSLEDRLKKRSTETAETLAMRISKAEHELSYSKYFDEVLVNNELEKALTEAELLVSNFIGR